MKTREEMERLRGLGLQLLQSGLLKSLEIGCKPHERTQAGLADLMGAAEQFRLAETPGMPGGYTNERPYEILGHA